jgi:hypothetical protein
MQSQVPEEFPNAAPKPPPPREDHALSTRGDGWRVRCVILGSAIDREWPVTPVTSIVSAGDIELTVGARGRGGLRDEPLRGAGVTVGGSE